MNGVLTGMPHQLLTRYIPQRSSFNDNGVLIKPLTIRATGDIAGIIALIEQCHLTIEQHPDEFDFSLFLLTS
ncbi:TPA: hypothetical protein ACQ39K_004930 [Yersinia enterocolitica]